MGTKYADKSGTASGYNASPPADDGTQVAANQVKWATIKTKLADTLKTYADAINTALVNFCDFSGTAISGAYTTAATDHMQTLECTGTFTVKLLDASTAGKGYIVGVKNVGSGAITVTPFTGADTLDGTAGGSVILTAGQVRTYKCNVAASGYMSISGLGHAMTQTVLTSGTSATYNTPTGATMLRGRMVGGGAGGSGAPTGDGTDGTATTFSTFSAGGGNKSSAGGTSSGGTINITGGMGARGSANTGVANLNLAGGIGGSSAFGGAGGNAGLTGGAAAANSGSGGAGGIGLSTHSAGNGGGAGGYCEWIIYSPAATYTYTVGAKGTGGSGADESGGNGADGIIIVDEYY